MNDFEQKIWSVCLEKISERIGSKMVSTWFKPLQIQILDKHIAEFTSPNDFFSNFVEEKFYPLIKEVLTPFLPDSLEIRFKVNDQELFQNHENPTENRTEPNRTFDSETIKTSNRLDGYSFNNFIVGPSNQLAFTVAQTISSAPGKTSYNPYILYSASGLGKTHLLSAIYHQSRSIHGPVPFYLTSEQFIHEFTTTLFQKKNLNSFYSKYRNTGLLILDDIQFFMKKDRTQEIFLEMFNGLINSGKQIVLSSDRPPHQLKNFNPRLSSRLQAGFIADIQPPDLETRLAILNRKTLELKFEINPEIVQLLATRLTGNVRELEGALKRIAAYQHFTGKSLSLEKVHQQIMNFIPRSGTALNIDLIQSLVSKQFQIPDQELKSASRQDYLYLPRQVAMYLSKKYTCNSNRSIADYYSRDPVTVMNACKNLCQRLPQEIHLQQQIDKIEQEIKKVIG